MWSLNNLQTGNQFYMLSEKEKYTVSRNNDCGDLILSDDSSISRKHAFLRVHKQKLYITDAGSKYGTFINENINTNQGIKPNEPIDLSVNDKIRFGRLNNIWSVQKLTFQTLPSTLSTDEKEILVKDLNRIDGQVLQTWSNNCTHLTISNLTITIKVLQALCRGIPIVTPSYWKSIILTAENAGQSLPKYEDFLPPMAEQFFTSNNSTFYINLNRKTVFTNRTFIFMIKKHMEQFESLINLADGKCISLDQQKVHKKTFIKSNVSVIQYNPSTQSQTSQDISTINDYLHKNNCRSIPDSEIGLAILHCSTVKFCNPHYKRENDFNVDSLRPSTSKVLVENTPISVMVNNCPDDEQNMVHKEIIPETEENKVEFSTLLDSAKKNNDNVEKILLEKENQFNNNSTENSLGNICLIQESNTEESLVITPVQNNQIKISELKRKSSNQLELTNNKKKSVEIPTSQNIPSNNFLVRKPRSQNTETETVTTRENNTTPTSRKRVRELLASKDSDDDDDNDDNIFKFNKNPIQIKKSKFSNETTNSEDHFMFTVKPTTTVTNDNKSQSVGQPSQPKQSIQKVNLFDKSIKSFKCTMDGWLSVSMLLKKIKIKSEDESEDDDTKSWINQMQNGFQVKVKHMELTRKVQNIESGSVTSQNKNGVNYKAFVKKINYIPQTKVLKTVASY